MLTKTIKTLLLLLILVSNNVFSDDPEPLPRDDENRVIIICGSYCQNQGGSDEPSLGFTIYLGSIMSGQVGNSSGRFRLDHADGRQEFGSFTPHHGAWFTQTDNIPVNFGEPII